MAGIAAAGLLGAPIPARAQAAPTIVGSLANFDVVNETEGEKEGFEIQLEGLEPNDITRVFGQSGSQCYIRYCIGSITPYGTPGVAPFGVYVRWTANYDAATQRSRRRPTRRRRPRHAEPRRQSASDARDRRGVLERRRPAPPTTRAVASTSGSAPVPAAFPIATKTVTYRWLVADPAAPGQLIAADPLVVPPVPISHPIVQGAVVGGVPDVQMIAPAAPPVAPAHRYGKAEWVKVYKTELDRDADLDELVGGHPNDVVPERREPPRRERDRMEAAAAGRQESRQGRQPAGRATDRPAAASTRFSAATSSTSTPARSCRQEARPAAARAAARSSAPTTRKRACSATRAVPGDLTTECVAPGPGEVGDFIGAQMAAENLGNRITPVIAWPTPASIFYGTPLGDRS